MQTPIAEAPLADVRPSPLADHLELTKPRITLMVVVTTAVGLLMAVRSDPELGPRLGGSLVLLVLHVLSALVGTALLAAGASALNMWAERRSDALMERTASRPLPSGRLLPDKALETGLSLSAAGSAALFFGVNGITALLGLCTLLLYVFVYTPLKRISHWNTHIGAIPGALPILMGYTAWNGEVSPLAWALFGLLFFWQLPHFFAIDWIYRAEYAGAGYRMLSARDPSGRRTAVETVLFTGALVAASLSPPILAVTSPVYAGLAALCGALFLVASIRFGLRLDRSSARAAMLVSVLYLPTVLGVLSLDALLLTGSWNL